MRVLTVGFAFVIVTTSMYTASLAAFMTRSGSFWQQREIGHRRWRPRRALSASTKTEQSMYDYYGETSMTYKVFGGSTSGDRGSDAGLVRRRRVQRESVHDEVRRRLA